MTDTFPSTTPDGPRAPRDPEVGKLLDLITGLEDLVGELEGCVAASSVISAVLLDQSLQSASIARSLWWTAGRAEDLVDRLKAWHGEATDPARAAAAERRS